MNLLGFLLGLVIFIAVLAFVLQPLVRGDSHEEPRRSRRPALARQMGERARLLEERNAIYTAIQELDFDHETGKVEDDYYAHQRARLVKAGVAVLMQLDRLEPETPAEDALEAEIKRLRERL